jgi:hypothetical protein
VLPRLTRRKDDLACDPPLPQGPHRNYSGSVLAGCPAIGSLLEQLQLAPIDGVGPHLDDRIVGTCLRF